MHLPSVYLCFNSRNLTDVPLLNMRSVVRAALQRSALHNEQSTLCVHTSTYAGLITTCRVTCSNNKIIATWYCDSVVLGLVVFPGYWFKCIISYIQCTINHQSRKFLQAWGVWVIYVPSLIYRLNEWHKSLSSNETWGNFLVILFWGKTTFNWRFVFVSQYMNGSND